MAIAFGGARNAGVTASSTTAQYNYDVGSGADRFLLHLQWLAASTVGLDIEYPDPTDLTRLETSAGWFFGAGGVSAWGLAGPASGSNLLEIAVTTSQTLRYTDAHYTGVKQTVTPHKKTNATGSSTGSSLSLTPDVAGCWGFLIVGTANSRTVTAGAGSTLRTTSAGQIAIFDSNGPLTPGVPYSMAFAIDASAAWGAVMVLLEPAAASAHLYDAVTVWRARYVLGAAGSVGAVAEAGTTVARDRRAVAAALEADAVPVVGGVLARDRRAVAGTLAPATAAGGGAATVTRTRWVLAAAVTLGAVGVDAAPVVRDRVVVPAGTLAPHAHTADATARDRVVVAAGVTLGAVGLEGGVVARDRTPAPAGAQPGGVTLDAAPVTRSRAVAPVGLAAGVVGVGAGAARDRVVAAAVATTGAVSAGLAPVVRDRRSVGSGFAPSGGVAFGAAPVVRDRVVAPLGGGEPLAVDGATAVRERVVVAAALGVRRPFPNIRTVGVLGDPPTVLVVGNPPTLDILDEEGNVGRYALKVGSTRPKLKLQLRDEDGDPVPLNGTPLASIYVGFRRSGETDYALLLQDPFVEIFDADDGVVAVAWGPSHAENLGPGDIEAEVRITDGDDEPTRFPVEGWVEFRVWEAIVPEPGS